MRENGGNKNFEVQKDDFLSIETVAIQVTYINFQDIFF